MKKRTYNVVAFIIIPSIILMIFLGIGLCIHYGIWNNSLDKKAITGNSLQTELWNVIEVSDMETAYIIYGLNDWDIADDAYVIAIQGWSITDIDDMVEECYPGAFRTSYLKDKDDYRIMDFTGFSEVRDYLKFENSYFETALEKTEYINSTTHNLKHVRVYDISDYLGYKEDYNNGKGILEIFALLTILPIGLIVIILELVIALIIKLIINRNLK